MQQVTARRSEAKAKGSLLLAFRRGAHASRMCSSVYSYIPMGRVRASGPVSTRPRRPCPLTFALQSLISKRQWYNPLFSLCPLIHFVHSFGVAFGNLSPFGRLWSILLKSLLGALGLALFAFEFFQCLVKVCVRDGNG